MAVWMSGVYLTYFFQLTQIKMLVTSLSHIKAIKAFDLDF